MNPVLSLVGFQAFKGLYICGFIFVSKSKPSSPTYANFLIWMPLTLGPLCAPLSLLMTSIQLPPFSSVVFCRSPFSSFMSLRSASHRQMASLEEMVFCYFTELHLCYRCHSPCQVAACSNKLPIHPHPPTRGGV